MLGISHHSKEDQNKSIIYILPVQGGKPRRITAKGPSYLHGWSPDGKFLIYTGEETENLTSTKYLLKGAKKSAYRAKGLDDGPEYTPDGKYIYFNSIRTGTCKSGG